MDDRHLTKPGSGVEQTDDSITRRQLLKAGTAALVGLTLSGLQAQTTGGGDPVLEPRVCDRWFYRGEGAGVVHSGNEVLELIDGPQTFWQMVQAIRTANAQGHFIYLIGWWLTDGFPLLPRDANSTITALFTAAARRGVEIRAMLWNNTALRLDSPGADNMGAVSRIDAITLADGNTPANAAAILDNRHISIRAFPNPLFTPLLPEGPLNPRTIDVNVGSHHQKVLIVNGSQGLLAFCGGIDINPDRLYRRGEGSNRQGDTDGAPFHDIHCRIKGPAAGDLLRIFVERWRDHPGVANLPEAKRALLGYNGNAQTLVDIPNPLPGQTNSVQVGRTYGNGSRYRGIGGTAANPQGYAFARNGEQAAARMFLQAIANAQEFIYIEDQYFVDTAPNRAMLNGQPSPVDVRAALRNALQRIKHLTILIPHWSITDLRGRLRNQTHYRRLELIRDLRNVPVHGQKVRVFFLHPPDTPVPTHQNPPPRNGYPHTYVHAKTWIFDDQFAIIGSANTNRRSWTHDSEAVVGICDQGDGKKLWLPHRLRMRLWAEHLNVDNLEKLRDGVDSVKYWLDPQLRPPGARIQEYDYDTMPFPNDPQTPTAAEVTRWNDGIDPDGS